MAHESSRVCVESLANSFCRLMHRVVMETVFVLDCAAVGVAAPTVTVAACRATIALNSKQVRFLIEITPNGCDQSPT